MKTEELLNNKYINEFLNECHVEDKIACLNESLGEITDLTASEALQKLQEMREDYL